MSPEGYELHEARFVQEYSNASLADGLYTAIGPVPAGKVWTILAASLGPSVAETRTVWYSIRAKNVTFFPVTVPAAIALGVLNRLPLLTMGMEIKLYPQDYLYGHRDVATAGSTLSLYARVIETDLPYYSYEEPLNKVVKQSQRHGSVYRSSGAGISIGGSKPDAGRPGGEGGGGRESY